MQQDLKFCISYKITLFICSLGWPFTVIMSSPFRGRYLVFLLSVPRLTKPDEVGDFFALVSMKSPRFSLTSPLSQEREKSSRPVFTMCGEPCCPSVCHKSLCLQLLSYILKGKFLKSLHACLLPYGELHIITTFWSDPFFIKILTVIINAHVWKPLQCIFIIFIHIILQIGLQYIFVIFIHVIYRLANSIFL